MNDSHHAHLSIREGHLSYVRGCRGPHCRAAHSAYNLENSRKRSRESMRATVRHEDRQLSLLGPQPHESESGSYRAVSAAGNAPQVLRRASSPAVGKHHRDPDATEQKAAKRQVRHGHIREWVLKEFVDAGDTGLTRHECAAISGLKLQTVCARVVELVEEGWLVKTKRTRLTETNSSAGVLIATEAGKRQLRKAVRA